MSAGLQKKAGHSFAGTAITLKGQGARLKYDLAGDSTCCKHYLAKIPQEFKVFANNEALFSSSGRRHWIKNKSSYDGLAIF